MEMTDRFKPQFWTAGSPAGPGRGLFNYTRIWRLAILLLTVVTLAPLLVLTVIDYNVTRHSLESENLLRTARTTSNTRRTLAYFLDARHKALEFVATRYGVESLREPELLAGILGSLKQSFGGFVDLGLIDNTGRQVAYNGPYSLLGRDYSTQEWFASALSLGKYTSDVFLGYRDVPHLIIARHTKDPATGEDYVLRATLDTEQFNAALSSLDLPGQGDAFIINSRGVMQTPSRYMGSLFSVIDLPIPPYSETTSVLPVMGKDGTDYTVGFAYIEDTPFILLVVKKTAELMKPWETVRMDLLWLLVTSVVVILVVIVGVSTYMVDKIYVADQTRANALHQMEHTNRMASIGRLAAGVAHEINNPLAIINEKAGLIKDLFSFKEQYAHDRRLLANIDSILASVERCGRITKRLLSFARHIDVNVEVLRFKDVAEEVLSFLHKEAEYRNIAIVMSIPENMPEFVSDRGKLQQIFLNLVNNAFQAMNDGGRLSISAARGEGDTLDFTVRDNGCGIPEADRKRIFEPFFSTKKKTGGTGLGLSITYGLVQELGGSMAVESEVGKGTAFTITLPLKAPVTEARKK
ncbi:MAG: two-component sensor histidine kinase [Pseudodesulfovibrio sp.]|nr:MULTISPECIES: PAS domain-containing sensor histidine kinase [Pseudodesulfovibrio]MBU4193114.1 two-component sensor histidine kinase [Pseudomonadota bacterium]MBU4244112.1 two-component sensor histidine kinase [Pseudomonadota bacterium]MBU4380470.1 two-component sensor histidine kinase [Pseudomonadota bacterium]MBU4476473.1 two-component sensor histidine kinase [Pseudomonadota bacterium]MBU4517467.1 two-component sensor histidine kinase [Pseudomonadota bacterium]